MVPWSRGATVAPPPPTRGILVVAGDREFPKKCLVQTHRRHDDARRMPRGPIGRRLSMRAIAWCWWTSRPLVRPDRWCRFGFPRRRRKGWYFSASAVQRNRVPARRKIASQNLIEIDRWGVWFFSASTHTARFGRAPRHSRIGRAERFLIFGDRDQRRSQCFSFVVAGPQCLSGDIYQAVLSRLGTVPK